MLNQYQITGGSTMNTQAECRVIAQYLGEIERIVGLKNIPGEILVYTTPPSDPTEVDQLFAAGADVSHAASKCGTRNWRRSLRPARRSSLAGTSKTI